MPGERLGNSGMQSANFSIAVNSLISRLPCRCAAPFHFCSAGLFSRRRSSGVVLPFGKASSFRIASLLAAPGFAGPSLELLHLRRELLGPFAVGFLGCLRGVGHRLRRLLAPIAQPSDPPSPRRRILCRLRRGMDGRRTGPGTVFRRRRRPRTESRGPLRGRPFRLRRWRTCSFFSHSHESDCPSANRRERRMR